MAVLSKEIGEFGIDQSLLDVHQPKAVAVSIIIPVTERCDDLFEIYRVHHEIMKRRGVTHEFIFVIDGGFEQDGDRLRGLIQQDDEVRVIQLSRSFGEATALGVGFKQAQGEIVVSMPSYFQTTPEGLDALLDALDQDCDVAIARRWPRHDSWLNKLQNYGFHFVVSWFTGVTFHDLGCGLKGMKKRVAQELQLYGDLHRFLPLLAFQRGFRFREVDVPQHQANQSTRLYKPGVYLRRLLDILTIVFLFKFTKKPLRFFGLIGSALFFMGFSVSLYLALERLMGLGALAGRPILILGVLLMVLGVQTASIGLIGEIIIFTHARKMKDYTIEKFLK